MFAFSYIIQMQKIYKVCVIHIYIYIYIRLRRSARTSKPADQEKYKLVRVVQQLEEKRSHLRRQAF